jgi:hypothetical protein
MFSNTISLITLMITKRFFVIEKGTLKFLLNPSYLLLVSK